jgi:eukaryotic-like serine/threonine-protein kinase
MRIARLGRTLAVLLTIALLAAVLSGCGPKVPDVVGKPADEAVRVLQDAGYKLGTTGKVYTTGLPPGQVFSQIPQANERVREGTLVNLTITFALGEISVPDVSKLSADEASQAIAALQLVPMQVDQYSDSVAKGSVGGQVPEAGATVSVGATVVYVVSKGSAPEKSKVPDITGDKQSDADAAIKKAGLKSAAQKAYSDSVAKGVIVLQNPASGASVSPGSTVSYVVSLGKPPAPSASEPAPSVTVPNVVGKKEADANSAMQSAGLSTQTYRQADPKVPTGVVIGQMPPAGSKTAKGGVVGLLISSGSESTVEVPSISAKNAADAKAAIEAAGLVAYPVDQPSAEVKDGVVIQQVPVAGSIVPLGSEVLYAVSTGVPE